jgi:hypothetical protein
LERTVGEGNDAMVMPVPERDERAKRDPVHEEAERIAVPNFDWFAEPIGGMIDAAIAIAPHHSHPRPGGEPLDRQ